MNDRAGRGRPGCKDQISDLHKEFDFDFDFLRNAAIGEHVQKER